MLRELSLAPTKEDSVTNHCGNDKSNSKIRGVERKLNP